MTLDRGQDDRRMQQAGECADETATDRPPPQRHPDRRNEIEMPEDGIRALTREGHDRGQGRHQAEGQRDHGARLR